jgi:segregation and condensation protein B
MKSYSREQIKQIVEAAIFSSSQPVSLEKLKQGVFAEAKISTRAINIALSDLKDEYSNRGVNLVKLASGYRFQVAPHLGGELEHLWQEKPGRYSRALLETLALIAYKQPITRGEIENVRGVSVGSNIIRTLLERNWVKVVGHKEVPGRPSLYGTTNEFLDYFSLSSLAELPELMEAEAMEVIAKRIDNEFMGQQAAQDGNAVSH